MPPYIGASVNPLASAIVLRRSSWAISPSDGTAGRDPPRQIAFAVHPGRTRGEAILLPCKFANFAAISNSHARGVTSKKKCMAPEPTAVEDQQGCHRFFERKSAPSQDKINAVSQQALPAPGMNKAESDRPG
jgi:hypothetical protein